MTERRLDQLARANPDWRPWLAILRPTCAAIDDRSWRARLTAPASTGEERAPRLAGAQLAVDATLAREWIRQLVGAAAGTAVRADVDLALDVIQTSLDGELECGELARRLGVDAARLTAVLPLAAVPLLHAARAVWPASTNTASAGTCPTCGAWPMLAELRGLERSRHLRCGRCGEDWEFEWLRCPFCDEREHARLSWLAPETTRETRRVETCASCRGYLKTVATLAPASAGDLLLEDLATVDLDVAALQEGATRPVAPPRALGARVTATGGRRRILAWR